MALSLDTYAYTLRLVSLVDGYNLPMRIDNNKGCGVGSCPVDLGPNCEPRSIQYNLTFSYTLVIFRPLGHSRSLGQLWFPRWLQERLPGWPLSRPGYVYPTLSMTQSMLIDYLIQLTLPTAALGATTLLRRALLPVFSTTTTSRVTAPTLTLMLTTSLPELLSGPVTLPSWLTTP